MSKSIRDILEGWTDDETTPARRTARERRPAGPPHPGATLGVPELQAMGIPPTTVSETGEAPVPRQSWTDYPTGGIIPPVAVKSPPGSGWGDMGSM